MFALTNNQQRIVDEIVRLVKPLRVLVFGSVARGVADPESDLDLLVVVPDGTHRRRTAQRLYEEVPRHGVPMDVLVTTPQNLHARGGEPGLVYRTILQEGVEVYVA